VPKATINRITDKFVVGGIHEWVHRPLQSIAAIFGDRAVCKILRAFSAPKPAEIALIAAVSAVSDKRA
jgi:hypothetical protein